MQIKQYKVPIGIFLAVLILFGGVFTYRLITDIKANDALKQYQAPPVVVSAVQATMTTWQPYITSTGTLSAVEGVALSSQVSGQVVAIDFDSGQSVKQGLLLQLENSAIQGQLETAQAALDIDKLTYARDNQLLKQQATTQEIVDTDAAKVKADEGVVKQYTAQISYTEIRAPFSGQLGIRQVDLGQYLAAGTAVTSLQTVDPIYVDYPLLQQDVTHVRVGQAITVYVGTYHGVKFNGNIQALDSQVQQDTRSRMVRAVIPNADLEHQLIPGMLVSVHTLLPVQQKVLVIPQIALTQTLYGTTVYVIKSKQINEKSRLYAQQVYVTVGDQHGSQVAITSGISPGDLIVTDGQVKLSDGATVTLAPTQAPTSVQKPSHTAS